MKLSSVRKSGPFVIEETYDNGSVREADLCKIPLAGIFVKAHTDIDFAESAAVEFGYLTFENRWNLDSEFLFENSFSINS